MKIITVNDIKQKNKIITVETRHALSKIEKNIKQKTKHALSKKKSFKKAIAMIELIFALVIMGIVLLSAPSLIHQSTQSSNVALQQESISALATHTGIVMSKHWDEADTNCTEAPILAISSNSSELNISNRGPAPRDPINENTRAGMRNVVGRNTALTTGEIVYATDSTTFGSVADGDDLTKTFDDIDDYHNHTTKLTIGAISTTGDYIDKDITITTEVTYAKDLPLGGLNSSTITLDNFAKNKTSTQKHIKLVSVRLTSESNISELDKNISMSAFSCNIGTYQPKGAYYK